MKGFKFNRHKNKFRWESDFMVLEFSNPSIEGFSSFTNLEDEKDIMYYYYTVKIFKKMIDWDDEDDEKEIVTWKLVSKRKVYDFPSIVDLKWILDYQLNDDTTIGGQKIEYTNGHIAYSKVMCTEGFACDDLYEIRKIVRIQDNLERYVVYVGTTFDIQGDLNSSGIRTPYVERKDIEELLNCVNSFIKYSIEEHNKGVSRCKEAYEIKNNKLYEYNFDKEYADKNVIEYMFCEGDVLDLYVVINNIETSYDEVTVSKITDNIVELDDGTKIDVDTIYFVSNNVSEEKLKYNEYEIAKEFIGVLSKDEILEFKNWTINRLFSKYQMSIIRRTHMCRDEHEYETVHASSSGVTGIKPVVNKVIEIIKTMI